MALAGLLTCSPFARPSLLLQKVADGWTMVMELTAAGQLRIYTVFPFNRGFYTVNLKRCKNKLRNWYQQLKLHIFD